jgi:DNA primase
VEGEPDAITGHELGLTAFGTPGTNGWRTSWAQRFRGRVCVVCFDCDGPGRTAAQKVAGSLIEEAREVRVVDLDPEREQTGSTCRISCLAGGTVRDLLRLAVGSPAVRSLRSAA